MPFAAHSTIEKIYSYSDIHSGSPLMGSVPRVDLASRTDKDGFRTITAQITIPYRINGANTPLYCRASTDELGDVTLKAWYDHPETGECTSLPINNLPAVVAEIETMVATLLDEKVDKTSVAQP
ncbi:hypothetical protein EOL96_01740 [Candidatus Saccharibacteria bacterium]|nr:hypothetical protein [Candidatus Saccharibacteria bacterium]